MLSISYGVEESSLTALEMDAFDTLAIKLGVMGVTIVVSSGDDGANSRKVRTGRGGKCGYVISYPTSSPYVTAVGATQGVELTDAGIFNGGEITCSTDTGAGITSGGGFSNHHMRANAASFQSTVVDNYLKNVTGTNRAPAAGFNTGGRAYPDLAAAGAQYLVRLGGTLGAVDGTSASAPFIAGLFSNINAKRLAAGKGSLGWVNPTLYQTYSEWANDITKGNNLCVGDARVPCCSQGFHAAVGWDPTTGIKIFNIYKDAIFTCRFVLM